MSCYSMKKTRKVTIGRFIFFLLQNEKLFKETFFRNWNCIFRFKQKFFSETETFLSNFLCFEIGRKLQHFLILILLRNFFCWIKSWLDLHWLPSHHKQWTSLHWLQQICRLHLLWWFLTSLSRTFGVVVLTFLCTALMFRN